MKLMDLKTAADRLGVHYSTAREFVLSGKLRSVRLAGRRKIQIREDDLEAFIEASTVGPNDGPPADSKPLKTAPNLRDHPVAEKAVKTYPPDWYQRVTERRHA